MRFAGTMAETDNSDVVVAVCATQRTGFAEPAIKSARQYSNSFGNGFHLLEL